MLRANRHFLQLHPIRHLDLSEVDLAMRVRFGSFTLVAVTISTAALTGCAGMRVVPVPAPAASLSSNVTTVQSGQTATLTWQTQNATTVTLNGNPVSATGSMQVNPLTTTTYTLVATGPTGTSPAQSASTITVTGPPAPVANLSTSAPTVLAGQSATLTWTTQNATAVTLNGTAVPASGTQTVTPSQDTTYTLVATGVSGTTPAQSAATVSIALPPTATLAANPTSIVVGGTGTLTWSTQNATTITLDGAPVAASGSQTINPSSTTTYTLVASGTSLAAPVTQTLTVQVVTGSLQTSVNHIIFEMQENRSFDHYFGFLNEYRVAQGLPADVDGFPADCKSNAKMGSRCSISVETWQGTGPGHISPYHMKSGCIEDLSSSWQEAHNDVNLHAPNEGNWGKLPPMNGFAAMAGGFAEHTMEADVAGARAMGFYTADDLPFYYWAATTFGLSDRMFSGALTRTQPNRMYLLAATSNGYAFPGAASNDPHPPMYLDNRENIFELLDKNNITWKVYISNVTYRKNSLNGTYMSYFYTFGSKHLANFAPLSEFATDAQAGTLPQVAMIEPDAGHDEHPLDQVDVGARFVRDQVVALMNSPSWQDSIFIMVFDEGGGMYDHVPPASMPPPDKKNPILGPGDPRGLFDTTGFRVPNLVISPFTKPGYVSHTNADFTAILKLIETRFLTPDPTTGVLPSLTARDAAQPDLTEFFDWTSPNLNSTNPPEQTGLPCYYSLP
jgi:phospholipase C